MSRSTLFLILFIALLGGCIKKVERPTKINIPKYYPLNVEDEFIYSGKARRMVTSRNIGDLYTQTSLDSTGDLFMWKDVISTTDGIWLKSLKIASPGIPEIHFEPPLPFAPWSNIVGDTLHHNSIEIRTDSINSHLRILVEYEIMEVGTLITPSGEFDDCIQVQLTYRTLDETESKFLDGISIYWYARNVGIVRFQTPFDSGELLQATVEGIVYP